MFNEINEGGLNRILSQRLGMQGSAAAPACAPELFPTLNLENDRPEWGWLKGEMLAANRVTRAAVAGQFSMAQLYLPSNANAICVVTMVNNWTPNALGLSRGVGISAGLGGWVAASVASNPRDFRWPGGRTQAIIEVNANVAAPTTFGRFARIFGNAGIVDYQQPVVIVPGTSLIFQSDGVNEPLDFNVAWYERPAVPGELG